MYVQISRYLKELIAELVVLPFVMEPIDDLAPENKSVVAKAHHDILGTCATIVKTIRKYL